MTKAMTNGMVLPGCGLPAWVVVTLDAMLSTGVMNASALAVLDADGLTPTCPRSRPALPRELRRRRGLPCVFWRARRRGSLNALR